FNKRHRDIAKALLGAAAICLVVGHANLNFASVLLSAAATIHVSRVDRGTKESGKNLKWLTLAGISFVASLISFALLSGQEFIDADRAYEFKIKLLFFGRFIQIVWGGILFTFVASTFTADSSAEYLVDTSAAEPMSHNKRT
ncbi:MAG: hypothetical protein SGARI_007323, partial [Bacillariaceae sp.]